MYRWRKYVPVAARRRQARREMDKLRKKGKDIQPVEIEGQTIARTFWGKAWCEHIEKFSDYANRLPRGQTYVRNGSVCHLDILPGKVRAIVSGSELYKLEVRISPLPKNKWTRIQQRCAGQIGSMIELLQGTFSDSVMQVVTHRETGLFPLQGEIKMRCNCPDWAGLCKHLAAVLYGVGSRLDTRPELLFLLRGVDQEELICIDSNIRTDAATDSRKLRADDLAEVFGIDIDLDAKPEAPQGTPRQAVKATPATARKPKAAKPRPKKARGSQTARPAARRARSSTQGAGARIRPTGKSVARLRKKLKMTPGQFAELLGVSEATVRRWESIPGRLKLHDRTLQALAGVR